MPCDILKSMNKLSFQTAFYTTGETKRDKGSTGFLPGSHRLLDHNINTIELYHSFDGKKMLEKEMYHGDMKRILLEELAY